MAGTKVTLERLEKYMNLKGNPIIHHQGVCDPHIHIFEGKAYLYAGHDDDVNNTNYCMRDWQIWSSEDLVHWEFNESVDPSDFFVGESNYCWATDAAEKNGLFYFYFSNGNTQTGVGVSDRPCGGFKDVLGKPLLDGSSTTTKEYDPCVFIDDDEKATAYLLFGGPKWAYGEGAGYYIAKLNGDMISLAEKPRYLNVNHEADDKVSLNKFGGKYYLSWGSYYTISEDVYGPYELVGNTGVAADHTSYFEWNNQCFNAFTIFDPTMVYRATGICYIHRRENGVLEADQMIAEFGVGQYDALWNKIEAEWYMKALNAKKVENPRFGFDVEFQEGEGSLFFPNIRNAYKDTGICFFAACECEKGAVIEILENNLDGKLLGECHIKCTGNLLWRGYSTFITRLENMEGDISLCLKVKPNGKGKIRIDYFKLFAWRGL